MTAFKRSTARPSSAATCCCRLQLALLAAAVLSTPWVVGGSSTTDGLEFELILAEHDWNTRASTPLNGGRVDSLYTTAATLIPIDTNVAVRGTAAIAAYFKAHKTAIQARFADSAVTKCYNATLCTRHGQMEYSTGAGKTVISDARQLVVYTRDVRDVLVGGAASPGASAGSDSDSSDSSDSDNKKSKRPGRGLKQSNHDGVEYGKWRIAEMHQSAATPFAIPKPQ